MSIRGIIAIAALAMSIGGAEAAGPFGSIKVGNWSGGAYTNDNTGNFSGCIASASYKSGITLSVLVSPKFDWHLAFSKRNWGLAEGERFQIALTFDGDTPFTVYGRASGHEMIIVNMPDNSSLVRQFRAARIMTGYTQGTLYQFRLDGTSAMLASLVQCTKTVNAGGIRAATRFTAASTQRVATPTAAPPPTDATSIKPSSESASNPELQIEAIELASNFILKASLDNARLVNRAETPVSLVSTGAAWRADGATGFVRIIPTANVSGLDIASTIVGNDAKECKGKFLSARNSELVDSQVVFRGMSACDDSARSVIAEYFIFPRKKGGYTLFSFVVPKRAAEISSPQREQKNVDIRNAAYTVMK